MAENNTPADVTATLQPQPASYHDLTAGLPGADAQFVCGQLDKRATLEQARTAWMAEQQTRLEAAQKETAAVKAATPTTVAPAPKKPGVAPVKTAEKAPEAEAAGDDFNSLVEAKVAAGMDRRKAVVAVAKANPEAHRSYLESHNTNARKRELIASRFEE